MLDMLMVRGLRAPSKSGRDSAAWSMAKLPLVESRRPPAAWRNAPMSAGRAGDVAHGHAAAAHALQSVVRADQGGPMVP